MELKVNERFFYKTIEECTNAVFGCNSMPMKCYFSLQPEVYLDNKEYKPWFIRTDGIIKESQIDRIWRNTYNQDTGILLEEYLGNVARLTRDYDFPKNEEIRLLFSRIYNGSENIGFKFLGAFEYIEGSLEPKPYPIMKFRKIKDNVEW